MPNVNVHNDGGVGEGTPPPPYDPTQTFFCGLKRILLWIVQIHIRAFVRIGRFVLGKVGLWKENMD